MATVKIKKEEGVSLVEAKVEASKLSRGGKTYSIMEEDGDFFVREGHNPDAYQLYINGAKGALETPVKATGVSIKQSSPEEAIKALKKAKTNQPPVLSSLPAKVEKSRTAKVKEEMEEERAETKARIAAKQKAKPKIAIISSDEDEEEEEVVVSKSKKSETKNSNKMKNQKTSAVKKSMPLAWIVELIQEKKNVAKDLIRKKLEKDYAVGTVNTQMARLKNHPNLVVAEDMVKYKK